MLNMLQWIKKEIIHVFPAFLFFYLSFSLINVTEGFMFKKAGIGPFSFTTILIASAVVAKVLVVIDHLPFINAFPNKPLIFNVIWKTMLYLASSFCFRFLIRLFPFFWTTNSLITDYNNFLMDMNWRLFMAIQSWYVILFFVFVTFRELALIIGSTKVRRIFFGR